MKTETKRAATYVISADLLQACFNLWGRANEVTVANAMKNSKARTLLRAEQLRLALLAKAEAANEAPVSDDAGEPPAASSGGPTD